MTDTAEELVGTKIGDYTTDRLLGQGGFAWVFEAHRAGDQRTCALKVLKPRFSGNPEFEERFRSEMKVAADLKHPNIIDIFEISHSGDFTFFAMELFPGSLADFLEREKTAPEAMLHRIGMDISSALTCAHDAGFIHRDIKTANIMLRANGSAVLTDFGIARAQSGYAATEGANMTIGTPHYLSPEQAQGRPLDGRSDLYALGVTLYKAATGELPFRSTDWFELARMHVEEVPELPTSLNHLLSKRVERIILRCLAKHPDDRYSNAEELHAELSHVHDAHRSTSQFGVDQDAIEVAIAALEGEQKKSVPFALKIAAVAAIIALLAFIAIL